MSVEEEEEEKEEEEGKTHKHHTQHCTIITQLHNSTPWGHHQAGL